MVVCGNCGADLATVSRDPEFVERTTRKLLANIGKAGPGRPAEPEKMAAFQSMYRHPATAVSEALDEDPPEVLCAICMMAATTLLNQGVAWRAISPVGINQPTGEVETGKED